MRGVLGYWDGDSWLHRRNPTIKLASLMFVVLAVTLAFDPWTPSIVFVIMLMVQRFLGRIPLRRMLPSLAFFLVLSGLGFVGSNAFFYAVPAGVEPTTLWEWRSLSVTAEGIRAGVSLAMRVMAIVTCSAVFVTTTDPTAFVLSLIQQAHFPMRLGYGVLVAYRFVPLWQTELAQIRAAHRIRGVGERPTLRGRLEQVKRYAIPLLAGAIRKAERVSVAMDSKAFGMTDERTYYRRMRVDRQDWLMLAVMVVAVGALLWALSSLGLLQGFGVVPE